MQHEERPAPTSPEDVARDHAQQDENRRRAHERHYNPTNTKPGTKYYVASAVDRITLAKLKDDGWTESTATLPAAFDRQHVLLERPE